MPLFRCLIRGDNFSGKLIGKKKPIGFYTTRFVEAETSKEAELLALELLKNDPNLEVAPKYRTEDARVFFEKIDEVPQDTKRVPNNGFTFFLDT
ncbi:MAG: hypothetical protein QM719_10285 [Thermomonas sp.]